MDIITAIAPATSTPLESVVSDSAATGETPSFAAALEQAQTVDATPPAAAISALKPSVPEPVAPDANLPVAPPVADVSVEPEPEPEPVQLPPLAAEDIAQIPLPEPVTEDLAAAVDTPEQNAVTPDDDSRAPHDSLDAIRQRLDLIDTAGQMGAGLLAITPPVTWTPAPPADTEPALDPVSPDDGYPAMALEWTAPEEEALVTEARPPLERPLQGASATDATASATPPTQQQASTAPDHEPDLPPALSSLTPATSGLGASPVSAEATAAATPALGSDAWQADLGQQVFAMVRRGEQQMDMQLNPADLGPLSISLNVSEGGIQAQFQSAHASVRAAVEQALPQLQVALASQGLTLGEASVNDGASRQAMGEQPRRESQDTRSEPRAVGVEDTAPAVPAQQVASAGAGVDLYL